MTLCIFDYMTNYNYNNTYCHTCREWVWKGDGVWVRGLTYCLTCWRKRSAK